MAARKQTDEMERRLPAMYKTVHVYDRPGLKVTKVLNATLAYTADLEEETTLSRQHVQYLQELQKQQDKQVQALETKARAIEHQLREVQGVHQRQNEQLRSLLRLIPQSFLHQYTAAGQMPGDALCNYLFELKARADLLPSVLATYREQDIIADGDEDAVFDAETEIEQSPVVEHHGKSLSYRRRLRSASQQDTAMRG